MLRLIACALCLAAALFALAVGDGVRATAQAHLRAAQIATRADSDIAATQLDRTRTKLAQHWARPTAWHAGAMETVSWIDALIAERMHNDPARLAASRDAAVALVRLSPIEPGAWARLGALAELGAANELCAAPDCLATSWRVAPMLAPDAACGRLRIAHAIGAPFAGGRDQRIRAYLVANPRTRDAFQCLAFLPARARFEAFLFSRELQIKARRAPRYQ